MFIFIFTIIIFLTLNLEASMIIQTLLSTDEKLQCFINSITGVTIIYPIIIILMQYMTRRQHKIISTMFAIFKMYHFTISILILIGIYKPILHIFIYITSMILIHQQIKSINNRYGGYIKIPEETREHPIFNLIRNNDKEDYVRTIDKIKQDPVLKTIITPIYSKEMFDNNSPLLEWDEFKNYIDNKTINHKTIYRQNNNLFNLMCVINYCINYIGIFESSAPKILTHPIKGITIIFDKPNLIDIIKISPKSRIITIETNTKKRNIKQINKIYVNANINANLASFNNNQIDTLVFTCREFKFAHTDFCQINLHDMYGANGVVRIIGDGHCGPRALSFIDNHRAPIPFYLYRILGKFDEIYTDIAKLIADEHLIDVIGITLEKDLKETTYNSILFTKGHYDVVVSENLEYKVFRELFHNYVVKNSSGIKKTDIRRHTTNIIERLEENSKIDAIFNCVLHNKKFIGLNNDFNESIQNCLNDKSEKLGINTVEIGVSKIENDENVRKYFEYKHKQINEPLDINLMNFNFININDYKPKTEENKKEEIDKPILNEFTEYANEDEEIVNTNISIKSDNKYLGMPIDEDDINKVPPQIIEESKEVDTQNKKNRLDEEFDIDLRNEIKIEHSDVYMKFLELCSQKLDEEPKDTKTELIMERSNEISFETTNKIITDENREINNQNEKTQNEIKIKPNKDDEDMFKRIIEEQDKERKRLEELREIKNNQINNNTNSINNCDDSIISENNENLPLIKEENKNNNDITIEDIQQDTTDIIKTNESIDLTINIKNKKNQDVVIETNVKNMIPTYLNICNDNVAGRHRIQTTRLRRTCHNKIQNFINTIRQFFCFPELPISGCIRILLQSLRNKIFELLQNICYYLYHIFRITAIISYLPIRICYYLSINTINRIRNIIITLANFNYNNIFSIRYITRNHFYEQRLAQNDIINNNVLYHPINNIDNFIRAYGLNHNTYAQLLQAYNNRNNLPENIRNTINNNEMLKRYFTAMQMFDANVRFNRNATFSLGYALPSCDPLKSIIIQDAIYYFDIELPIVGDVIRDRDIAFIYMTVHKFPNNTGKYIFPNENPKINVHGPECETYITEKDGEKNIIMIPHGNEPYQHPFPKIFGKNVIRGEVFSMTYEINEDITIVFQELSQHTVDIGMSEIAIIRGTILRNKTFPTTQQVLHEVNNVIVSNNIPYVTIMNISETFKNAYPQTLDLLCDSIGIIRPDRFQIGGQVMAPGRFTLANTIYDHNHHSMLATLRRRARKIISYYTRSTYRIYISGHNEVEGNPNFYHVQRPILCTQDYNRFYNDVLNNNVNPNVNFSCTHIVGQSTICNHLLNAHNQTFIYDYPYLVYLKFKNYIRKNYTYTVSEELKNELMCQFNIDNPTMISDIWLYDTVDEYIDHVNKTYLLRRMANAFDISTNDTIIAEKFRYLYNYTRWIREHNNIKDNIEKSFIPKTLHYMNFVFNDLKYYSSLKKFSGESIATLKISIIIFTMLLYVIRSNLILSIPANILYKIADDMLDMRFNFRTIQSIIQIYYIYNSMIETYNNIVSSKLKEAIISLIDNLLILYISDTTILIYYLIIYVVLTPKRAIYIIMIYFIATTIPVVYTNNIFIKNIKHFDNQRPTIANIGKCYYLLKHCINGEARRVISDFNFWTRCAGMLHVYRSDNDRLNFVEVSQEPCCKQEKPEIAGKYLIKPRLPRISPNEYIPSVYHKCLLTAVHPVVNRQLKMLSFPFAQLVRGIIIAYASNYVRIIKNRINNIFYYSVQKYYDHLSTKQKQEFNDVKKEIEKTGRIKTSNILIFGIFQKLGEKLINTVGSLSKVRNISGSPSTLKYIIGPFIYAIQKLIYNIDPAHSIPGSDMKLSREINESYKKLRSRNVLAISIDGSSFDSTQFKIILFCIDLYIYTSILMITPLHTLHFPFMVIFTALSTLDIIGYSSVIGYIVRGTVPSGKSNTTLGNSQRSAFYVRLIAISAQLIEGIDFTFRATGDDIFIIICADKVKVFLEHTNIVYGEQIISMHQIAKKILVTELEHAEYLSMKVILIDGDIYFIKSPTRAISNSFLSTKIHQNTNKINENNIKVCIKQSLYTTLYTIPLFKRLIDEIEVEEIDQEKFKNWIKKKVNNDRDYLRLYNNFYEEDNLTNFIINHNKHRYIKNWLSRIYNINQNDNEETMIQKFYDYTPVEINIVHEKIEIFDIQELIDLTHQYFDKIEFYGTFKNNNINLTIDYNEEWKHHELIKGRLNIYVERNNRFELEMLNPENYQQILGITIRDLIKINFETNNKINIINRRNNRDRIVTYTINNRNRIFY